MWFGKIETYAARIFDRFNQGEYELTRDDKIAFSCFIGLMLIRIPADRLTVERGFASKFDQFKERFPEQYRARMAEFAEDCGTFDENTLRQELIASYSLTRVVRDLPKTVSVLMAHNWFIHKTASRQGFVTSDRPALFHHRDKENPLGYVSMPLSPTLHFTSRPQMGLMRRVRLTHPHTEDELVASLEDAEPRIRVGRAEPARIKLANQMILDHALKYVFAASFDPSLGRAIMRKLG
jgi:hypothetical protein